MTRLEREIAKLDAGAFFYVNAINLTIKEISYLKTAVRSGLAIPTPETYNKFVNTDEVRYAVSIGDIIAPQGMYTKGEPLTVSQVLAKRAVDEFVYTNVVELPGEFAAYRKIGAFWFLWVEPERDFAIDAAIMGLTECADAYPDEERVLAALRRLKGGSNEHIFY